MAKIPWVSRELYERVISENEELKRKNEDLLNRLIGAPAIPVTAEAFVDELTRKAVEEPESFAPTPISTNSPSGLARFVQDEFNKKHGLARS